MMLNKGFTELDIIIVNFNSIEYLKQCVYSICEYVHILIRLIVVDGGSTLDERTNLENFLTSLSYEVPSFQEIIFIKSEKNNGYGSANNLGLEYVKAPYVLILNPDTLFHEDAIRPCIEVLETQSQYGCVASALRNPDNTMQTNSYPLPTVSTLFQEYFFRKWQHPLTQIQSMPIRVGGVTGAFMLVRKSVIDNLGLFDPAFFMYSEEVDLCKRIRDAGWKIGVVPQVSVIHFGGGSSPGHLRENLYYELHKSRIIYIKKHFSGIAVLVSITTVKLGLFWGTWIALMKYFFNKSLLDDVKIRWIIAWRILSIS